MIGNSVSWKHSREASALRDGECLSQGGFQLGKALQVVAGVDAFEFSRQPWMLREERLAHIFGELLAREVVRPDRMTHHKLSSLVHLAKLAEQDTAGD